MRSVREKKRTDGWYLKVVFSSYESLAYWRAKEENSPFEKFERFAIAIGLRK